MSEKKGNQNTQQQESAQAKEIPDGELDEVTGGIGVVHNLLYTSSYTSSKIQKSLDKSAGDGEGISDLLLKSSPSSPTSPTTSSKKKKKEGLISI